MKKDKFFIFITLFFIFQTSFSQRGIIIDPGDGDSNYIWFWYRDYDSDGLGNPSNITSTTTAFPPVGYVSNSDDCDDYDATVGGDTWWFKDTDGDGYGFITYNSNNNGGDLIVDIDGNPINNLNTLENSDAIKACEAPIGYVSNADDCDDTNPFITFQTWFLDSDGDGFGDSSNFITSIELGECYTAFFGYVRNDLDCDDSNAEIHPNTQWYIDQNGDGVYNTHIEPFFYGCIPPNSDYIPVNHDENYNWIHTISYDFFGNINSASRTYFDDIWRPTVSLAKDVLNNQIWGSEVTYDSFNRTSKSSFNAISHNSFKKTNFLSSPQHKQQYLDAYYSDNNSLYPYQATATHPYTEVEYDKLNPSNIIKTFGGNQIDGEWKTGYSFTTPVAQEMYYAFGFDYFEGQVTSGLKEVITKFYKTTNVDPHGVETVVFTDGEGKTLATARSTGSSMQYPVISTIGTQGYIDVYVPSSTTPGTLIGSTSNYKVYNLKTGSLISPTPATLAPGNAYRVEAINIPNNDSKIYINVATGGVQAESGALGVQYEVNYYDYSLNYYDKVDRLIKTTQPNGFDFSGVDNGVVLAQPSHTFATTYTYNSEDQLIMTSSPDEGVSKYAYRKDGALRFSQNAIQAPLNKVSYIEYDQYGRVIENGVISGIDWTNINNYVDAALPTDPSNIKSDQTFIVYDYDGNYQGVTPPTSDFISFGLNPIDYRQNNLAGNVVTSYTNETSSWYSYDIYGRVEWMVQNINGLGLKTIHYNYDANGNVKKVIYQNDSTTEKFEHVYTYDMNSQLLQVQTSFNGGPLVTNANYSYYIDGSLKRTNIANGLQGLDYVYTLGGMLKSINHPSLSASNDPGGDSNDVFGVILDYYDGDYSRPSKPQINTSPVVSGANANYYDGNIKAIRYANRALDDNMGSVRPKAFVYNYNDNKWLTNARYGTLNSSGQINLQASNAYNEGNINYDANGNITSLTRRNATGIANDILAYNYNSGKNQLNSVIDNGVATPSDLTDLETQPLNNYGYNAIGQMISNAQENLTYEYNALGLVSKVIKAGNTLVEFYYNERGERYKKVVPSTSGPVTEYYINDVSGTSMAIYRQQTGLPQLKELAVYGSERLGVFTVGALSFYQYEIADHLGNVRAVIRQPGSGNIPTINSYADYYPFGELLSGRNAFDNYRYAFQGQELDPETGMEAFKLRLWDGRIGRWLSPDPYGQYYSPYLGMGNNPINGIDSDGGMYNAFYTHPNIGKWTIGFGKGVLGGLKGLGKSLYYLGDTVDGLASATELLVATSGVLGGSPFNSHYQNALIYDAQFTKTNTAEAYLNLNKAASKLGNDLISSNPETAGEAWGNLGFALLGTKGLGTLTKTKTFVNVSSKAKNVVNLTNKADDVVSAGSKQKSIVIGEGMYRVKPAAKSVNAKWYQAWSKNFPKDGSLLDDVALEAAKARNTRWINSKIKQGYIIYDIGPKGLNIQSPFYQLEINAIKASNYPVIPLEGF